MELANFKFPSVAISFFFAFCFLFASGCFDFLLVGPSRFFEVR